MNQQEKPSPASPCILVIFGMAGDLTKRLLLPAICNLGRADLLNKNFHIIGIAKNDYTNDTFHQQLIEDIDQFVTEPKAQAFGKQLVNQVQYIAGNFADAAVYAQLKQTITKLVEQGASQNCIFYFASPPELIETIAVELNQAGLLQETAGFRRLMIEKPFGHDLDSAKKLNALLLSFVSDSQVYRIDHYLGKETVQNLLAFRFSNSLFEPTWNRLHIDHIQITVAETLGVELRGGYYDHVGALKDMVPNHIFQMLSLITMEPPAHFNSEEICAEKLKVLHDVQLLKPEEVNEQIVRGQYGPGEVQQTQLVGYQAEPRIEKNSTTETYVALKLFIDNWRWWHVPFYLRTGKRLSVHQTEIVIQYKAGPCKLFDDGKTAPVPNVLRIIIQPDEGISLSFNVKSPGPKAPLNQVEMKFKYSDYYNIKTETGYEIILYDCMNGDHLLFKQAEMVEAEWKLVQPILDVWAANPPQDFPNYAAGTMGPVAADQLLAKDGRKWLL